MEKSDKWELHKELFYSGLTKEEYLEILPAIRDQNYDTWRMIGVIMLPVFAALFVMSFTNRVFMPHRWLYFFSALVNLVIVVYYLGFKGENRKAANIMAFIGAVSMYAFGIIISTVNSPNEPAVTFFVLQLAIPLVTMSQPVAADLLIVGGTALFAVCAYAYKTPALAEGDVYNAVIFMLVTLISNHHIQKTNATNKHLNVVLNREAQEAAAHANMDELTGVRSRYAYEIAKQAMNNDIAFSLAQDFAVAVFDINSLKECNDEKGHAAGDTLIKDVADLLVYVFRSSQIFRVGGDEFIVFFKGEDYVNREQLMNRIFDISAGNIVKGGPSVAGGMSELMEGDTSVQEAINRADKLMYAQKEKLKALLEQN